MVCALQSKVGHHWLCCQISGKPVIIAAAEKFTVFFLITVGDLNNHTIFWVERDH